MKNAYEIIKRPLITEKTTQLVEQGKYTFEVAAKANKVEVKNAIETIFEVEVESVNIINVRKKEKRVGKYSGLRPAVRKAVITLKAGHTLDVFEV